MTATATMVVQSNVVIALADALARYRNGRGPGPLQSNISIGAASRVVDAGQMFLESKVPPHPNPLPVGERATKHRPLCCSLSPWG
jgi:hypothetical protein